MTGVMKNVIWYMYIYICYMYIHVSYTYIYIILYHIDIITVCMAYDGLYHVTCF